MQLIQKQSEIKGVKRPLIIVSPNGTTERKYCSAIAKQLPLADKADSLDWPVFGPVDLTIFVKDSDRYSLFDQVYLKFEESESYTIAEVKHQKKQKSWIYRIRKFLNL